MTPIFVAHMEEKLTLFQRSPACGENDGLGGNGESEGNESF
ncbi:hypothetical protein [Candidatus Spongiihabitans sp.]